MAAFAAALEEHGIAAATIEMVSEPMWNAAGLLDPHDAACEYVSMLVTSGMKERRRSWRGLTAEGPADALGTGPGDVTPNS